MYQKPTLQQHDLATALAACQPMPPEYCDDRRDIVYLNEDFHVGYDHIYAAGNCYRFLGDDLGGRIDVGIHLVLP